MGISQKTHRFFKTGAVWLHQFYCGIASFTSTIVHKQGAVADTSCPLHKGQNVVFGQKKKSHTKTLVRVHVWLLGFRDKKTGHHVSALLKNNFIMEHYVLVEKP